MCYCGRITVNFPKILTMEVGNIKILSFNCQGVINKLPVIQDLCNRADIILLQETWLMPHNTDFLNDIHVDFNAHSISAVSCSEILVGRPYGGLSILWRKKYDVFCSLVNYSDPRVLGMRLSAGGTDTLIINVYLPYYSAENFEEYLLYIGKITNFIAESETNNIFIIGDFNADLHSPFHREWLAYADENNFHFSDIKRLQCSTFSHINHGSLSKSWIDHCLASETADQSVTDIFVLYDDFLSDPLPLMVEVNWAIFTDVSCGEVPSDRPNIRWNFQSMQKTNMFYGLLTQQTQNFIHDEIQCLATVCDCLEHKRQLEKLWNSFNEVVLQCGMRAFGGAEAQYRQIPGWNQHV